MMNKRAFITARKAQYAVSTLCRLLETSRGWFYGFRASQAFRHRLPNTCTGFCRYDLENGSIGSIAKLSGNGAEVQSSEVDLWEQIAFAQFGL